MDFIQHIPIAMLQSIGFMALLFLLFEGIQLWKKLKSKLTYWIAICFQSLALIHFIVEIFSATNTGFKPIFFPISEFNHVQWFTYIGLCYLIVVAIYILYYIFQWTKLVQIKASASFDSNHSFSQWVHTELHSIGSSRKIHVGFSNKIAGPVTFGWIEPIILLPFSILNQLTTEEIKFILLHEMAHVIRHDFIAHVLLELVHLILCFNPFSYYFSKIIQLEREKSCDNWVVANTALPVPYSKALYQLAKYNDGNNHKLILAAVEKSAALLVRIQYINGLTPSFKSAKSILIKTMIGLSFASLLLINKAQNPSIYQTIQSTTSSQKSIVINSNKQIALNTNPIKKASKRMQSNNQPKPILNLVLSENKILNSDTVYQNLVRSTIAWIKAREGNHHEIAEFANFPNQPDLYEYTVAEQLMLKEVLHKYALKRAILANKISKLNSQEEAMNLIQDSKEWKAIQQYEQWASRFLKQHPNFVDTISKEQDF